MESFIKRLRQISLPWTCSECGGRITRWDHRCSTTLALPLMCENCIAKKFGKTVDEMNEYLCAFYDMRKCYLGKGMNS